MSLARIIAKITFLLPEALLLRMAGGERMEIDGRLMDVRTQLLVAQDSNSPPMAEMSPEEARKVARAGFAIMNAPRPGGVDVRDETIPIAGGDLAVRHYRPRGRDDDLPALLYYHMGGWVIGDLDSCDFFCALLALRAGAHVMSVDYRLAPEHKFPVPMEDSIAAYRWMVEQSSSLKVDGSRIGVAGDSAGGGISAVICHEAKKRGLPQPAMQLLIYPGVDLTAEGGSMESCAQCPPLTRPLMEWFGRHYLEKEEERQDVMASPLLREDFEALAPAIVITAGFDVLRTQGEAYAEKLRAAGNPVLYRCYDSLAHAFTAHGGLIPAAAKACEEIALDAAKMLKS